MLGERNGLVRRRLGARWIWTRRIGAGKNGRKVDLDEADWCGEDWAQGRFGRGGLVRGRLGARRLGARGRGGGARRLGARRFGAEVTQGAKRGEKKWCFRGRLLEIKL